MVFQSTPPVRAATVGIADSDETHGVSIHAAREGGDHLLVRVDHVPDVSIHAAREGGDAE